MNFTAQLMSHIEKLPAQEKTLPPSFIVSFVSRCFHPCLHQVDFPQALTAMDYLRDLEKRRCYEYVEAFKRLGISIENFDADVEAVSDRYPGIALWAKNMQGKNKKAESYYSIMYLGLRRWVSFICTVFGPVTDHEQIGHDQRTVTPALQPAQLYGDAEHALTSAGS
jgi:hypothetical protein